MLSIAELHAKLEAARAAHEKTGKAVNRAHAAWEKAVRAERDAAPMGIEEALEVYLISGEGRLHNDRGQKFLDWLNKWSSPRGIQFGGHHYPQTLQQAVKVALDHRWGKEELAQVAQMIVALMPVIRQGGLSENNLGRRGKPAKSTERDAWKVFDIFEYSLSERGDFRLVYRDDEVWAVYDASRIDYSFGRQPMVEGKLMTCLEYIRDHLWYTGGVREDIDIDAFGL